MTKFESRTHSKCFFRHFIAPSSFDDIQFRIPVWQYHIHSANSIRKRIQDYVIGSDSDDLFLIYDGNENAYFCFRSAEYDAAVKKAGRSTFFDVNRISQPVTGYAQSSNNSFV